MAAVLNPPEPTLRELRSAILGGQIELYLQPVVCLHRGDLAGVEGFLRWYRDGREVGRAGALMRLAEQNGLLPVLISAQLDQACALVETLDRHPLGAGSTFVSVNVSTRHLAEPAVSSAILRAVASSPIDPARLMIELNEAAFLDRGRSGRMCLEALRSAGIRLALDHFGSDAWSVRDLHELPLAEVKIDDSCIQRVAQTPADLAVVTALVDMAHALDLLCGADGVTDETQAACLRELGCDFAQGAHWGRPVVEAGIAELLGGLSSAGVPPAAVSP